ncbi:MAG: hypothetical protein BWZ10_03199 [candidate division BRC1 bacterium ADurb.BinA364]|nr:MAG: hypothetical protein BWZ10_03199 [candidate division BRC1 bacterium ADurb.BinA364]
MIAPQNPAASAAAKALSSAIAAASLIAAKALRPPLSAIAAGSNTQTIAKNSAPQTQSPATARPGHFSASA